MQNELESSENTAYVFVDRRALDDGVIPVYTSEDIQNGFMNKMQALAAPIKSLQMQQLGLSDEELAAVSNNIQFDEMTADDWPPLMKQNKDLKVEDFLAMIHLNV